MDNLIPIPFVYTTEETAHLMRRQYITAGMQVSLVAYNPEHNLYTFDVYISEELAQQINTGTDKECTAAGCSC